MPSGRARALSECAPGQNKAVSLGRLDLEKYLPFLISHLEGLIAEAFNAHHKHHTAVAMPGTTTELVQKCCRLLGTAERCLMQLLEPHEAPNVHTPTRNLVEGGGAYLHTPPSSKIPSSTTQPPDDTTLPSSPTTSSPHPPSHPPLQHPPNRHHQNQQSPHQDPLDYHVPHTPAGVEEPSGINSTPLSEESKSKTLTPQAGDPGLIFGSHSPGLHEGEMWEKRDRQDQASEVREHQNGVSGEKGADQLDVAAAPKMVEKPVEKRELLKPRRPRRTSEPASRMPPMCSFDKVVVGPKKASTLPPENTTDYSTASLASLKDSPEVSVGTTHNGRRLIKPSGNGTPPQVTRKFPSSLLDDIRPARVNSSNVGSGNGSVLNRKLEIDVGAQTNEESDLLSSSAPSEPSPVMLLTPRKLAPDTYQTKLSKNIREFKDRHFVTNESEGLAAKVPAQKKRRPRSLSLPIEAWSEMKVETPVKIRSVSKPNSPCVTEPVYMTPEQQQAAEKIQLAFRHSKQRKEAEWDRLIQEELASCEI